MLYKEFQRGKKFDQYYMSLFMLNQDIPPNHLSIPKKTGMKNHQCGICRSTPFEYLQENIVVVNRGNNIKEIALSNKQLKEIPGEIGMYCMKCNLDICSQCTSYIPMHFVFKSDVPTHLLASPEFPKNKNVVNIGTDESILINVLQYKNVRDCIQAYAIVCPKCDTQFGVYHMPSIKRIIESQNNQNLLENEYISKTHLESAPVTSYLRKFFIKNDDGTQSINMKQINELLFDEIIKAVDELSSVIKSLESKNLFEQTRIILNGEIEKFIGMVVFWRGQTELQKAIDSGANETIEKLVKCIKTCRQFIPNESAFNQAYAQMYKIVDSIRL